MDRPRQTLLDWMGEGTALFCSTVDGLSQDALAQPSGLPGWSRAHVVTHLARNADALVNLATWARTGVESPMYASREQRDADIEAGAVLAPDPLRTDLHAASRRLVEALSTLDEDHWRARVRTPQGRLVPASLIPWMRAREVWVHVVDLDAGVGFDALPPELVDVFLPDATGAFAGRADVPGVELVATDRSVPAVLGEEPWVTVRGPAARLLGWLLGREDGSTLTAETTDGALPALPRWL